MVWGEPPWRSDHWAMVFEVGFRVNVVNVFCYRFVSDIARNTMQYQ